MTTFSDKDILVDGKYAGLIRRYHAFPVASQLVGQHCWQLYLVYRKMWGPPPTEVTEYILFHDNGELGTGDVPLYGKRDIPGLKELMDAGEEIAAERQGLNVPKPADNFVWRVKACDLLEGLQHCLMDIQGGNQLAIPAAQNYITGISKHLTARLTDDDAQSVIEFRDKLIENHKRIMNAKVY